MKTCTKCKELKSLDNFYKCKRYKSGYRSACKICENIISNKWNKENYERLLPYKLEYNKNYTIKNKDKVLKWNKKKYYETPIENKARRAVRQAVKKGILVKPNVCSFCASNKRIHAHHWSYEEKNWLNVLWICSKCHGNLHRKDI